MQYNLLINEEKPINAISIFLELASDVCQNLPQYPQQSYEKIIQQDTYEVGTNSDTTGIDMSSDNNYLTQKQNQIKNLLNSFKNHILEMEDKIMMDKYCRLYSSDGINYCNLKKIVTKRIKDKDTRWNMKLKSLLKSNHLSQIFYDYLQNESMNWLNRSKVKEKDSIIDLIQRLIQYRDNNQIFGEIKTYKK